MKSRGLPAYVAELLGTFLLVFSIAMVATLNSEGGLGSTNWAVIGLVHVFVLATLVATLGGVSGGHFNPAVTTTMLMLKKVVPADAVVYIAMQIIGAIAAVLLVKVTLNAGDGSLNAAEAANFGAPGLGDKFVAGTLPGIVLEAMGTFILVMAIMGVAVNTAAHASWAPLSIGMALGLGVMIIGPMTGAGFNPARAFAPALIGGDVEWGKHLLIYWLGPILGGGFAGVMYKALFLKADEPVATVS